MTKDQARFLDAEQIAERLGTTERFARRLIEERRIAFYRFGKYVRVREDDLDAFIAAGRVEATRATPGQRRRVA